MPMTLIHEPIAELRNNLFILYLKNDDITLGGLDRIGTNSICLSRMPERQCNRILFHDNDKSPSVGAESLNPGDLFEFFKNENIWRMV